MKKYFFYMQYIIFFNLIETLALADTSFDGGQKIIQNTEELKNAASQWGTTFAAGAVIFTASIAVASLILPWHFLKETIGKKAWVGLSLSIILYIVLSFFGDSIKTYVGQIYTCPLSIVGLPCE